VDWRSQPLSDFPPISVSKADTPDCEPHQSAIDYLAKYKKKSTTTTGKTGAYRPPHARNGAAGAASFSTGRTLADLHDLKTSGGLVKPATSIPGYAPVNAVNGSESKAAQKNRRKRANKKENEENASANSTPTPVAPSSTSTSTSSNPADLVVGGVFSLEEKKIRNLLKKLRAIEALKQKQENFEQLEDTQVLKIQTEGAVRKELESLGWNGVL
jgi:translation initiation factor 2A